MSNISLTSAEKAIINVMRIHGVAKKTIISEISRIPWSSTVNSINTLIEKNIIIDDSNGNNSQFSLNSSFAYFMGVSIGSSHIKINIINSILHVVKKNFVYKHLNENSIFVKDFWEQNGFIKNIQTLKTFDKTDALWCATTPDGEFLNIKNLLENLCNFAIELKNGGLNLKSICICLPGKINCYDRTIIESRNLDVKLINVNIRNLFTSSILESLNKNAINIYLEHNVKAAAVAEMENESILHSNNGIKNVAIFYLGTGLGVSYVLNSKLYRGNTNLAGQLGHIKVDYHCKTNTILEQSIRDIFSDINLKDCTGYDLANWLSRNNTELQRFVQYITTAIYNIYMLLEIDTIILSGKLSYIYIRFENEFQEKMISSQCTNVTLLPSDLDEYSASIGSAICGYYNYLDLPYEWD